MSERVYCRDCGEDITWRGPQAIRCGSCRPPRQAGQVPRDHPDAHKPVGWGEHPRDCNCGDCP